MFGIFGEVCCKTFINRFTGVWFLVLFRAICKFVDILFRENETNSFFFRSLPFQTFLSACILHDLLNICPASTGLHRKKLKQSSVDGTLTMHRACSLFTPQRLFCADVLMLLQSSPFLCLARSIARSLFLQLSIFASRLANALVSVIYSSTLSCASPDTLDRCLPYDYDAVIVTVDIAARTIESVDVIMNLV